MTVKMGATEVLKIERRKKYSPTNGRVVYCVYKLSELGSDGVFAVSEGIIVQTVLAMMIKAYAARQPMIAGSHFGTGSAYTTLVRFDNVFNAHFI